jgi:hypothetical protein
VAEHGRERSERLSIRNFVDDVGTGLQLLNQVVGVERTRLQFYRSRDITGTRLPENETIT